MIECNIYSGRRGRIDYQETGNFESLLEAELYAQEISELYAQEISEMDAKEYGYPIGECEWLAVETATDNIPYDERVGVMYL